jgi:hypothetical protein
MNPWAVVHESGVTLKIECGIINNGNIGIKIPIPNISIKIVRNIVQRILLEDFINTTLPTHD